MASLSLIGGRARRTFRRFAPVSRAAFRGASEEKSADFARILADTLNPVRLLRTKETRLVAPGNLSTVAFRAILSTAQRIGDSHAQHPYRAPPGFRGTK